MASKNWVLLSLKITALELEYSIDLLALPRASKGGWSVALGANGDLRGEYSEIADESGQFLAAPNG